jgi:lysozyme family protein
VNDEMTIDEILDGLVDREGQEYTDDPDDIGGPTKFGITQKTLSRWRGYHATKKDVQELQEREARAILRYMYVDKFNAITWLPLRVFLVDWHVNGGGPISRLQRILKVKQDGIIGKETIGALAEADQEDLHRELWRERLRYFGEITRDRPRNAKYILGWINRMLRLQP